MHPVLPASRKAPITPISEVMDRFDQQPVLNKLFGGKDDEVQINQLKEGDFLVMLGNRPGSCCICFFSLSWVASHISVVLNIDGKLRLVEATEFISDDVETILGVTEQRSGVISTEIEENLRHYSAVDVYRPVPDMTNQELQKMKDLFYEKMEMPYEKNFFQLVNVGLGCPFFRTKNSYHCSEFVAEIYKAAGRLEKKSVCCCVPDWRWENLAYRPTDIPNHVNCVRLGHVAGTTPLWDVSGWTFGLF